MSALFANIAPAGFQPRGHSIAKYIDTSKWFAQISWKQ